MDKNYTLVTLNVGGKTFTTYYDTLKQSSYFQKLIETKKGEQAFIIKENDEEVFFIDRDGQVFDEIMHYLRSFEIRVDAIEELEKLKIEAIFFAFTELVSKIEQALRKANDKIDNVNYCLEEAGLNADEIISTSSTSLSAEVQQTYHQNKKGREIYTVCYIIVKGIKAVLMNAMPWHFIHSQLTLKMTTSDLSQETSHNEAKSNNLLINLNVGGASFSTSRDTLLKSKYFASLLSEDSMANKTINNKGEIFIDRSGDLFREILYFMRTGSATLTDKRRLASLQEEAEFYQLQGMIEVIKQKEQTLSEMIQPQFFVKGSDFLETSNKTGISTYIARREANGETTVYQVIAKIDVAMSGQEMCSRHTRYNCVDCYKEKFILRRCNKELV
ncbi:hypothetical protein MBANPS3_000890 [Mucor bainieri]